MTGPRSLPTLATVLTSALLLGACQKPPPPRPPPPKEAQPAVPGWFPEQPWNEKAEDQRVFFKGKVVFDTASAKIRPGAEKVLKDLLTWLQQNPDVSRIRLEGHTDSRAGEDYNQGLSERRAIAVADWLVDHGLDHNRVLAVAFGELRPLAPNDTSPGRQENRRTSFYPAEVDGRNFRGEEPTNGGLVLTVLSKEEREAMKNKGEVPKYTPPPVNPTKHIIEPVPVKGFQGEQAKELLKKQAPTIDASTGEPQDGGSSAPAPDAGGSKIMKQ